MNKYLTIKQTATTGILSEYRLRLMHKEGQLPGFYAGSRYLVNVEQLEGKLNELSKSEGVRL